MCLIYLLTFCKKLTWKGPCCQLYIYIYYILYICIYLLSLSLYIYTNAFIFHLLYMIYIYTYIHLLYIIYKYLCNFWCFTTFIYIKVGFFYVYRWDLSYTQINAKVCSVTSQLSQSISKCFHLLRSYQRI